MWQRIEGVLTERVHRPNGLLLFTYAVYTWMLLHALYMWPMLDVLWGSKSWMMPSVVTPGLIENLVFHLNYVPSHGVAVWWVYVLSIIASLVGIGGRWMRLIVFASGLMLMYGALYAFNSGFYLMQFFGLFLFLSAPRARNWFSVALTNVAFWMCRIQFVLVYAEAAFYKWMGTTWLEGSAMHYAAQLDHFIRPGVASVFLKHRWLSMFFSFAGLAYQTAFPLLIWVRKARIPLLLAGVFFHGFIATAMKLPEFGTAMMVGYLLFIEEDSARKVLVLLRLKPVQSEQ